MFQWMVMDTTLTAISCAVISRFGQIASLVVQLSYAGESICYN